MKTYDSGAGTHGSRPFFKSVKDTIKRAIDRERELVSLKYGAGLTNRAIARLLGLTESNVGTILHRTVTRLRAGWDEGGAT